MTGVSPQAFGKRLAAVAVCYWNAPHLRSRAGRTRWGSGVNAGTGRNPDRTSEELKRFNCFRKWLVFNYLDLAFSTGCGLL